MRPARNPTSSTASEYELASLPVGARFRLDCGSYTRTGTLLEVGLGSCVVRWDSARPSARTPHRKFQSSVTGGTVEFDESRSRTSRCALETPVEFLHQIQESIDFNDTEFDADQSAKGDSMARTATLKNDVTENATVVNGATDGATNHNHNHNSPTSTPTRSSSPSPTPIDTAKARALTARWKMAVTKLGDLLAVDSASALTVAQREKIETLYGEAVDLGIQLPAPATFTTGPAAGADPVFQNKAFAIAPSEATVAASGPQVRTRGVGKARKANGREDEASEKAGKTAAKTAKVGVAKVAKTAKATNGKAPARAAKSKSLHPCLCGCGESVAGRFKQGHDARYKGLVLQVEREEITESKLPAYMRSHGGVRDGEPGHPMEWKKLAGGDLRVVNPAAKIKRS